MKKLIALLLVLTSLFALCACGAPASSVPEQPAPSAAPAAAVPDPTPEPDPAPVIDEEAPSPAPAAEPVVTAYLKEGDYTDDLNNPYHYLIRIPAFAGTGGDILRLNTETYDFVMSLVRRDLECIENNEGYSLVSYNADYEYHVNGGIVSLLCSVSNDWGQTRYRAVNIDSEGHELSREEVLAAAGLDEDSFLAHAKDVLGAEFAETQANIPEIARELAEELNAKTLSDENLKDTQLFFNGEGRLCIVVRVYSLAGADWYWRLKEL